MRIPEERIHPDFRPLPLWAWNGEMTEHRIAETLQQFSDRGFGGAFIHPRPGLVTEYLSETWFDLWRFAQSTAHALGLQVHLYDENSYPSGFAGGHVLERRPEFSLRKLVCILASEPTSRDRLQEFSLGANRLAIELQPTDPNGWYGGKTYVDLLQPGATEEFLRLTHERYSLEVDCQGLLAFTDEPQVMDYFKGALPWSEMVQHRFREMHGWDLTPQLPHLFANIDPESPTLRYRYQETLLHLFEEHFLMPMAERCKSLGMAFTGHFHEHEWPCPRYHANSMLAQSWMHIPGIDLLGFQFDPANRQTSGRWLLTILEAVSVAAQQGKCKILCEAYGGGGYQVGLGELKRMGDYLLANESTSLSLTSATKPW